MNEEDRDFWVEAIQKVIEESQKAVTPFIGTREGGQIVKIGADGTPTKHIDVVAEDKVMEVLEGLDRPLILISEEIGQIKMGKGTPEVILVVDPLDGTSNAVKNIPAYGISVAVAPNTLDAGRSPSIKDIEIGMVKNFANGDIYSAVKGEGAQLNGKKMKPSSKKKLSESSLGAYVYRMDMEKIQPLCKTVRRMRILGSVAIELCYVADGTYEAFVDIRKNLRMVDVSAAKLILEESGCVVTNQNGEPLNGELNVLEKTSLIAASNRNIHGEIISILGGIR